MASTRVTLDDLRAAARLVRTSAAPAIWFTASLAPDEAYGVNRKSQLGGTVSPDYIVGYVPVDAPHPYWRDP